MRRTANATHKITPTDVVFRGSATGTLHLRVTCGVTPNSRGRNAAMSFHSASELDAEVRWCGRCAKGVELVPEVPNAAEVRDFRATVKPDTDVIAALSDRDLSDQIESARTNAHDGASWQIRSAAAVMLGALRAEYRRRFPTAYLAARSTESLWSELSVAKGERRAAVVTELERRGQRGGRMCDYLTRHGGSAVWVPSLPGFKCDDCGWFHPTMISRHAIRDVNEAWVLAHKQDTRRRLKTYLTDALSDAERFRALMVKVWTWDTLGDSRADIQRALAVAIRTLESDAKDLRDALDYTSEGN